MRYEYELVLGLPHTNANGLADHLLLAHAGYFQWASIASAIKRPLSELRTLSGGEVYATFYFIEERFPPGRTIASFGLDDHLRFAVFLRAFKNVAVEGQIVFDEPSLLRQTLEGAGASLPAEAAGRHPFIRFGNIFITPERGNSVLRVAPPANADFSGFPPLPNDENPYHITKGAEHSGDLGLLGEEWRSVDRWEDFSVRYQIDPDRDTNGAGLVYFANYVAFMDAAERRALSENAVRSFSPEDIACRAVRHRRVAYYGNVDVADALSTRVSLFESRVDNRLVGVRYAITREHDGRVICRSEAIKVLPRP